MTNAVDKWILGLVRSEELKGWGIVLYILITLTISAVLSFLIGLERYRRGENAGMRTHALLAVGSCFLMTISIFALDFLNIESQKYDISRIAAGTVTGIGFLGAGVIIKDKFTVKGLSTATTLWICAAVGLATGAGFILEAIIATGIALFIVFIRNIIIVTVDKNAPHVVVKCIPSHPVIETIKDVCNRNDINLKSIDIAQLDEKELVVYAYFPYKINSLLVDYFCNELAKNDAILSTKVEMKERSRFKSDHES